MKDTVSHYIPPPNPLTSTAPQAFSNNLTMPAKRPDDRRRMLADPRLIPHAVEELLRVYPI
jgi:cytochrome P450